jgi:hypothetical protein
MKFMKVDWCQRVRRSCRVRACLVRTSATQFDIELWQLDQKIATLTAVSLR